MGVPASVPDLVVTSCAGVGRGEKYHDYCDIEAAATALVDRAFRDALTEYGFDVVGPNDTLGDRGVRIREVSYDPNLYAIRVGMKSRGARENVWQDRVVFLNKTAFEDGQTEELRKGLFLGIDSLYPVSSPSPEALLEAVERAATALGAIGVSSMRSDTEDGIWLLDHGYGHSHSRSNKPALVKFLTINR